MMPGFAFTPRTLMILQLAREDAERAGANQIALEHLLRALTSSSAPLPALRVTGVDLSPLRKILDVAVSTTQARRSDNPAYSPELKSILDRAIREARALGSVHTESEHLFLAALAEPSVQRHLADAGLEPSRVRAALIEATKPGV